MQRILERGQPGVVASQKHTRVKSGVTCERILEQD